VFALSRFRWRTVRDLANKLTWQSSNQKELTTKCAKTTKKQNLICMILSVL